jgi:hypothetical protein
MNLRVVATGTGMIVLAVAFFFGMLTTAPRSNDPVELMRTAGMVSGVVGAIGLAMVVFGLFKRSR